MTNAPETRKTHVVRIAGTNKQGDVLQDIWVDVERIDQAKSTTKRQGFWQGSERKFRWSDDPAMDDYHEEGTSSRKTVVVKVCSPDEDDVNDPEEWVPVRAIRFMKMRKADQNYQEFFLLDETARARKVTVRKIVHYDTSIDNDAQAAFDGDPSLKAFVVQGPDYTKKDGSDGSDTTKDDGQFVDHEIVEFYKPRTNELDDNVSQVNLNDQVKLLNQYLIDESDGPDGKVVGVNGINPPYRLDPYQNIVNVKFKTLYLLVSVNIANQSSSFGPYPPAPSVDKPTQSSKIVVNSAKLIDKGIRENSDDSGFADCFQWQATGIGPRIPAQEAWVLWKTTGFAAGVTAPISGACKIIVGGVPVDSGDPRAEGIETTEIDFARSKTIVVNYLYRIPVGDGLIEVDIGNIMANFDSGLDTSTYSQTEIAGGGSVAARVYSTIKGKPIKHIDQLIDFTGDGKPRPTEDDKSAIVITNSNQGKFLINVHLDKDTTHAQIDNYGKKFQPYKATFKPSKNFTDFIPSQPPLRLPKP